MACDKTVYRNEKDARREARKIGDRSGDAFRAYICQDCGAWHITTSEPRRTGGISKTKWPRRDGHPVMFKERPSRARQDVAHTLEDIEQRAAEIRAAKLRRKP